ncbi:hypothetical protein AAHE18_15G116000 [Arachis hypogaea]
MSAVATSSSSSVSVPGVHLVRRAPAILRGSLAVVCRAQAPSSSSGRGARSPQPTNRSFFLELSVFESSLFDQPQDCRRQLCSSSGLCLRRTSAPLFRLLRSQVRTKVSNMLALLKWGIGVHGSGLIPILKEVIEILFQEGLIKWTLQGTVSNKNSHANDEILLFAAARALSKSPW